MWALGLVAVGWCAPPPAEALSSTWEAHRAALDAHARHPLAFTDDEWRQVSLGKVARRRERLEGTDRVLGLYWVDADLDTTWLAAQDPHGSYVKGFVEERLPGSTFQDKVVYQRITLPWPLAPRQWVIRVRNNLPLIAATGGRVWERTWDVSPERGAAAERENAVWLDVNDGGWFFVAAGTGTLLCYHARTVVGGMVPEEAATRWSFGQLEGVLTGIADRVPFVRTHYDAGHEPMKRPDGAVVPPLVGR